MNLRFKLKEIGLVATIFILLAFVFPPVPLNAAEPSKVFSDDSNVGGNSALRIGVGGYQAVEAQKDKALALASGFRFRIERQPNDNSIVISLKIPGDAENAFDQFAKICRSSALQLQKSLSGLDRWIENGCRNLDKAAYRPSLFTNPMVTSATRYCSHLSVTATPDARVKTVAQR